MTNETAYHTYVKGDIVTLTYRMFDLTDNTFLGLAIEHGVIQRVWTDGKTVTIRTESGKTFVRDAKTSHLTKV